MLPQLIVFSYYYDNERNYCTLGFILIYRASTFPSLRCETCKAEILGVDCNKRLIQHEVYFILQLNIH
jgi:hypothetical protein